MNRFLRRLSLFLLPLLVLGIAAEAYVRHIPNSYRTKHTLMERMADSVETIVLGNSHAYSGIRPELLPSTAVNLANVSQTLDLDRDLLLRYAPRCPQLKNVVLILDNSNIADPSMETTDEWFRITYYTLYMNHLGGHYLRLRYYAELLHFDSFQGKVKKWWAERQPDCSPLGWNTANHPELKNEAEWDNAQADRTLARHNRADTTQAVRNIGYAAEIARYCHTHGLRLLVVATPVCARYADGILPAQQRQTERAVALCRSIAGATRLDLQRDSTFTAADFFDPDHLIPDGAARLTRKIALFLQENAE